MRSGTQKTTIGNPDTYFRKDNGIYDFVTHTTQQSSIYEKIKEDIEIWKSRIKREELEEICRDLYR